jgi:hypothetical protein
MQRILAIGVLFACIGIAPATASELTSKVLTNPTAYIVSQCYTKTTDEAGAVHNPCYTCHTRSRVPTYINDQGLQKAYSFPEPARVNPWTNLFVDRSAAVAAISDTDIITYIRGDNYHAPNGGIALVKRLENLPSGWDYNKDGRWSGYVPDCYFLFDGEGFDVAPDGRETGWRAFTYIPVAGTFWPTNGSTDDVLIRLPEAYRQDAKGRPDRAVYKLNLAIVEALLKRADVAIPKTDETRYGVDLDRNGKLGKAVKIAYDFAPLEGRTMHYVGRAKILQDVGKAPLAGGLYPLGTEFLHSVRYIDVNDKTGKIAMAARMKELRYMIKTRWQTYADREEAALAEAKERDDFPDRIAQFDGDVETGISNGTGWRLQGFIEDAKGDLRPQTFEETVFCMGCHGGIGSTDDDTFAFPRKVAGNAPQWGWGHWTQGPGLRGLPELVRADGAPEFAHYLKTNGAGDEFRGNAEVRERFFSGDGTLRDDQLAQVRNDLAALLYPSRERALSLNKAYRVIVKEQSFIKGRDATITPQSTVHRSVAEDEPTGVTEPVSAWYER